MALLGNLMPALPWCITLACTACGAILSSRNSDMVAWPRAVITAERRPLSFLESLAATYVIASLMMGCWIIYHLLYKAPPLTVKRQVVDIELVSQADYANRHDPLPGTEEKTDLRKRTATAVSAHGSMVPASRPNRPANQTAPVQQESQDSRKTAIVKPDRPAPSAQASEAKMIVMQPLKATDSQISAKVQPWLEKSPLFRQKFPVEAAPRKQSAADNQPFMEEVEPPELVEMLDNDGDTTSLNVWQAGGNSSGGNGKRSSLAIYLKALNHKIKSAWSPPRGKPWRTEVLFRLSRTGKLISARILRSSGNAEADEAALAAVARSAPFAALPADYEHDLLDLHYTFNYSVDELTETTRLE